MKVYTVVIKKHYICIDQILKIEKKFDQSKNVYHTCYRVCMYKITCNVHYIAENIKLYFVYSMDNHLKYRYVINKLQATIIVKYCLVHIK